ncbi:hypothetical protein Trydic_g23835 [Trypoxylus dichotomus]
MPKGDVISMQERLPIVTVRGQEYSQHIIAESSFQLTTLSKDLRIELVSKCNQQLTTALDIVAEINHDRKNPISAPTTEHYLKERQPSETRYFAATVRYDYDGILTGLRKIECKMRVDQ